MKTKTRSKTGCGTKPKSRKPSIHPVTRYARDVCARVLLTGRLVFEAGTVGALLVAHAREAPRRPSSLTASPVPAGLDQLVLDCLAKDPAARPHSADAFAERLVAVPFGQAWTESVASEWWETYRPSSGRSLPNPQRPASVMMPNV